MIRKASLCAVSLLLSLTVACGGGEFETPTGSTGGAGGNGGAAGSGGTGAGQSGGSAGVGGSSGAITGGTGGDTGGSAGTGGMAGGAGGTGGAPVVDCTGVDDGTKCVADSGNTLCLEGSCVESRCGDRYVDADGDEACDDGQNGDDTDGCTDECKATCTQASDCADANVCNGAETCSADNVCEPGTPISCDDGNPCTTDSCIASNGSCSSQTLDDGAACGSGRICLSSACLTSRCGDGYVDPARGEECDETSAGCTNCQWVCTVNSDCNDMNACTTDTCNLATHTCTNITITCAADGDPCSVDTCDQALGCNYPQVDGDGDGFSPATCKAGGKFSNKGGDCNDNEPRAFPGQTTYFTTPAFGGGYDFNCDSGESRQYTNTRGNFCGGDSWETFSTTAPACGVRTGYGASQTYVATDGSLQCEYTPIGQRTQGCR